jgi:hypothetical protein
MSGFRVRLERLEKALNTGSSRDRCDAAEAEARSRLAAEPRPDHRVVMDWLTSKYGGSVATVAMTRAILRKWKERRNLPPG